MHVCVPSSCERDYLIPQPSTGRTSKLTRHRFYSLRTTPTMHNNASSTSHEEQLNMRRNTSADELDVITAVPRGHQKHPSKGLLATSPLMGCDHHNIRETGLHPVEDSDAGLNDGGIPVTQEETPEEYVARLRTQQPYWHGDNSLSRCAVDAADQAGTMAELNIHQPYVSNDISMQGQATTATSSSERPTYAPGPKPPPPRSKQQRVSKHDPSAWKATAKRLPNEFASEAEAAGRWKQPAAGPREDRMKETFKKTSASQSKLGAPRRFDRTEYTVHDAQGSRPVGVAHQTPPHTQRSGR